MDTNKNWKILKSEYLYREPWFTVRKECVELPNGHQIPSYYVLEYPDWVNVIAVTREKQFVFVRQYRHGLGQINFELCAGVCEKKDATPLIAAKRELMEETGYGNGIWREYMILSPNPSTHTNLTHCFLAEDVEKTNRQHLEETEDLSVHLLSFEEVKQLLYAGEIKQALMAAPLWKYAAHQLML
ncbi:MAG: NUDIX hydrolase [Dysgonamonadaceae bacterium]|jgi:ADP-ribose pyrophosphatase|nr:NUDIX hydrolase [Dysgonamonadaceae bacterium]